MSARAFTKAFEPGDQLRSLAGRDALAEALRRSLALPLAERLELFAQLRVDLGGELETETEGDRQIRTRNKALQALRQAASLLDLADDQAPTVAEFDRIAKTHQLGVSANQVRQAFGRWETACAALLGQPIPMTAIQRALRRALGGGIDPASHAEQAWCLEAVQLWLASEPPDLRPTEYDCWRDRENERRLSAQRPLPRFETILSIGRIEWDAVISVGRNELSLDAAREYALDARLEEAALYGEDAGALATSFAVGQLLGIREEWVQRLEQQPTAPQPVARIGQRKVWLLADVIACRNEQDFDRRRAFELNDVYLGTGQLAELLDTNRFRVPKRVARQAWDLVPRPVPVIGDRVLVWRRADVDAWRAERPQRRPRRQRGVPMIEPSETAQPVLDPRIVGARVRAVRQGQGLRQSDLGELAGIARGQLSKIENAKLIEPSLVVMIRIANALGCGLDALVAESAAGDSEPVTPEADEIASEA